jgi:hypothetical protein
MGGRNSIRAIVWFFLLMCLGSGCIGPPPSACSPQGGRGCDERGGFKRDPIALAQKIGKKFGVEGVVLGWVFRYEDRIGSAISVERPASVSFVIHVIGVKEGHILWSNPFQETQQALSKNVLKLASFLRRRGTWLKAKGLASLGMDEVLVSFPASRQRPEPQGA